ncbi:MAG: Alcohol dehydrogenase GroES-like protein [Pedosphaera sp.]|nr:Alcohol dehydrogenase GroES-like protein [Pedosphaera sp.]
MSRMADPIPRTMQAMVYRGVNDLRLETVPVPRIGAGELLVRVAVCGVCPTDIKKIHYGTVPPPRIFGHETAGTIAQVGARVKGFRVGERVALHHHVPCLKCHACRHRTFAQCAQYKRTGITAGFEPSGGGYAEYVRVMSFVLPGVVKIPARNTFVEGAMQEPVNTVLKAVKRLALLPGDTVLVAGQGPIGLIFTRLLALRGIRVIASDLLTPRVNLARKWGAKWALRADKKGFLDEVRRLAGKQGLDGAIIAVPSDEAMLQAQILLNGGGKLLLFAHTRRGNRTGIDLSTVCVDEKDLIGSYSSDFTLQQEVARLVFSRKLDVRQLITHEFPLEKGAEAVDLAAHPQPTSLKVMVWVKNGGI